MDRQGAEDRLASIVLGPTRQQILDDFLIIAGVALVPVDAEQLAIARSAHLRLGRGADSRARLSFEDCFSYALAVARDEPLLLKGDDFRHTDVTAAI